MSAGASAGVVRVKGTVEGKDGKFVVTVQKRVLLGEKQRGGTVRSVLVAAVHSAFTECADALYATGKVSQEERIGFSSAIGDALGVLNDVIDEDAALKSASNRPVTAEDMEAMHEWGED